MGTLPVPKRSQSSRTSRSQLLSEQMVTADQVSITQPDTDNYSHQCRITDYPNQMQVFGLWDELGYLERTHANVERTCKFHRNAPA